MIEKETAKENASPAAWAFALVFLPGLLLFFPFFFHHSDEPAILGYSRTYARFLSAGAGGLVALALAAAASARRRGNLNAAAGLLLMLVTVAAMGAAGEIVLRIRHARFMTNSWGQQPSIFLGYENRHYHTWSNQYGVYRTEAAGFRAREQDPGWRGRDRIRVFALGESSTFGLGLVETNTWTWRLEQRLREVLGADRVDVINAGNSGHNSLQIFLQFFFKVWPERPDVVILYLAKNDAVTRSLHSPTRLETDPWKLMSYSKLDYVARMNEGKSWYFRTLVSDFLRDRAARWKQRVAAARTPGPGADGEGTSGPEDPPDFVVQNGRDFLMKHIAAIADGCRRLDATLVLVTFAHVLPGWDGRAVDYYNQLVREFAEREGWPLVDFARVVASTENPASYFWDDHHPNEAGAHLLAEALFEVLRDRVDAEWTEGTEKQ